MHLDAELDVPMHAVAPMANTFGAIRGGAESERTPQRAAWTLQTIPNRREAGDDELAAPGNAAGGSLAGSRCARLVRASSRPRRRSGSRRRSARSAPVSE